MSETRYILVGHEFDTRMWAVIILRIRETFTWEEMSELVGVSVSCLKSWSLERYKEGFEHPSMKNLLIVCNLMDITPSVMFKVSEK